MKRLAALALVLPLVAACNHDRAEARESLARAKQLSAWHRDREAETALRDAARLDPTLYEARMRLARVALDARRFGEAKTQAASVVRDVPRSAYALELLGRAELGLGHDAAALDALTKSRDGDAAHSRVRLGFELGRIDERLGNHDDALAAYRTVVTADPHALEARIALAHALMPVYRTEVRTLLAQALPLAAPASTEAAEIDGLLAWCERLDAPRRAAQVEENARFAEAASAEAQLRVNRMLLGALGSDGALSDLLVGGAVQANDDDALGSTAGVGIAGGWGAGGGSGGVAGPGLGGLARTGGLSAQAGGPAQLRRNDAPPAPSPQQAPPPQQPAPSP